MDAKAPADCEETCAKDVGNRSNRVAVLEAIQHAVRENTQTGCCSEDW
jgi:hypothetical protein